MTVTLDLSAQLQEAISAKLAERDSRLQPYLKGVQSRLGHVDPSAVDPHSVLSTQTQEITAIADVEKLLSKIADGTYSAEAVMSAYCERAALAHMTVNPITEVLFKSALERAKELDHVLQSTGKVVGPLHGLPISVKDAFDVAGHDSTIGYASFIGKPCAKDALALEILKAAGAIPFLKTNAPQAMKWGETDNFIWGRTTHPSNKLLSPGGSSGGEGALLGFKGSVVGLGTDIGGSVRMPAANCGLYTIRPTMRRLPNLGVTNSMTGLGSLESTIGPMSRTLSDATVVDMPWREYMFTNMTSRKLCFGVQAWDHHVMPHPPNVRAIEMVVDALVHQGHEVVEFPPFNHQKAVALFDEFMQLDRGSDHASATAGTGEPIFPGNLSEFQPNHTQLTGTEVMEFNAKRDAYRQQYLEHWQNIRSTVTGSRIDCVIGPVMPHAAPGHEEFKYLSYTKIWSLLDYPAGVVPITRVNTSVDKPYAHFNPVSTDDAHNASLWSPDKYAGSPIGVQVVGKRFHEEEVLAAMQVIAEALGMKALE